MSADKGTRSQPNSRLSRRGRECSRIGGQVVHDELTTGRRGAWIDYFETGSCFSTGKIIFAGSTL